MLEFRLLGPPQITWHNKSFTLPRRQARALLFKLATSQHPISKDTLLVLFWPETDDVTARKNLSRLISYLRYQLPRIDMLSVQKDSIGLNYDLAWSDALAFKDFCNSDDAGSWASAIALYRKPFLSGFNLSNNLDYEHWQSQNQQLFERLYLSTLSRLVVAKRREGDNQAAIRYAQQYLETDDLAEEIHRDLIDLYATTGNRNAALKQYEICVEVLERELGISPLPETHASFESALHGDPGKPATFRHPSIKPTWTVFPSLDLPLIGRDTAWQELESAYQRMCTGGVIFISGEPGVGKSRLMQEFASGQSGLVLTGNNHATGQALPYQSIVQALRLALPVQERWIGIPSIWLTEISRLLPELRAQFPNLSPPVDGPPLQTQSQLFEALTQCFRGLAKDSSLLLCLDDVHWTDEGTLGWLQYLANRSEESGFCIFATYRTNEAESLVEWQRELRRAGHVTNVRLDGLSELAVAELIQEAGVNQETAAILAARIYAATGGNAFFVLETIRELLETNRLADQSTVLPLSPTIREVVLGRVNRLSPLSRQIAATLAVLSPLLTLDIVIEVSGRSEFETENSLEELVNHQLLIADGQEFRFQHDLTQQAIYEEIRPWRQRLLHERAAKGLERLYLTDLASYYPSLAYHWSQVVAKTSSTDTALVLKAVDFLHKAGEQAMRSSSDKEAIFYFDEAIDLIQSLPETPELNRQELDLLIALYAPLGVAKGYGAPEVASAFNRAQKLSEKVGDPDQLFLVLYGLWGYNLTRGDLQTALELAQQCLRLAESVDNSALLMEANRLLDETHYFRGEFLAARKHLEQGYEIYDPRSHHTHATTYAQDPGVAFLSYGSWLWWLLGYPDRAQKTSQKALTHGQTLSHLGSQAYSLTWSAVFHHMLGEVEATRRLAGTAITLSVEHGFALFLGVVVTLQGWSQAKSGQIEEGIIQIRRGIDDLRATGAELWLTNAFATLAEAYGQKGQFDKGLMALDEALGFVEKHEERWWEAELYRLRGELLLLQGAAENMIEDDFRRAIDIARQQKAKSLELRAAMSLSRLWQLQGRQLEARQLLAEIYDWFTEGFDSADLKEARKLLRKLP